MTVCKLDQLPDTESAHLRFRYRYTVACFAQGDDGFGLWGNRLTTYAATGSGMEDEVAAQFKRDYPDACLLSVSESVA